MGVRLLVAFESAALDGAADGFGAVAQFFGEIDAAAGRIANSLAYFTHAILGFFRPVTEVVSGVFIAALQITAELFSRLGREHQPH